jgi:hypothetical protein
VQAQRELFTGILHRHPTLIHHLKEIRLPAPG